jgi:hypothetical protein
MYQRRTPRILRTALRPAPTPPKDLAMKTSDDPIAPHPNRRSLIVHHHDLLKDPEVVVFLDKPSDAPTYDSLAEKLIHASEPGLLLELIRVAQRNTVVLGALDEEEAPAPLPDGLFEYLLQHIDQIPSVTTLVVKMSVLSSACCTLLQTALTRPTCAITILTFSSCTFADAHVQFALHAPTVHTLSWADTEINDAASPMDQMLSALAGWAHLTEVSLSTSENALNFAAITQMLVHNPNVTSLSVSSNIAPALPGDLAYQPQQDPSVLLTPLMNDKIALTQLTIHVQDAQHSQFNGYFLQHLGQCLMTNTTLEFLAVPGIRMCTPAIQNQFNASLEANHSLISLAPMARFGGQMPSSLRRNQRQRYWLSQDFVLGAAQAFLRLLAIPQDVGARLAQEIAPTPAERAYSGAMMSLICKATHQSAVKLRSAGFREAALIYIRTNDRLRCLELLNALLEHPQLDLLPEDKRQVIEYARKRKRLNFLPSGYAH